jgi:uncharacterized protein (DUF1684 family)
MKKIALFVLICLMYLQSAAQTYEDSIIEHRKIYKAEFLEDDNSPLKKEDLQYLDFFEINPSYKVVAQFSKVKDKTGFTMHTHSGKEKHYFKYGKLQFKLFGKKQTLYLYQSKDLMAKDEYKDYLFLPFTDNTNYKTTFGGGRYLDFKIGDIQYGNIIIDFNKCYNPYCAFAGGYSCPIPPKENDLKISVEAGEKLFLKEVIE